MSELLLRLVEKQWGFHFSISMRDFDRLAINFKKILKYYSYFSITTALLPAHKRPSILKNLSPGLL